MKKKISHNIGYKKERVVLSDILPYEIPPFFSNRFFYNFLIKNKIEYLDTEGILKFKKDSTGFLGKVVKLVFGIEYQKQLFTENISFDYYKLSKFETIPFKFRISHKNHDYRELTIIHPVNQLRLIDFYDKYKNTIIYNTKVSRFSLRKASKVATLKYYKDSTNNRKRAKNVDAEIVETTDKEYTSLKTFFSYENYSNIYKFYESYEYQRAEKKFDKLIKFDISKCFDSIYTHTLPWAIYNKTIIKDTLRTNKNTFGHKFDDLMQKMNYNETNGIIIGPEFSRIFAEIILQRIDKNVEKQLYVEEFKYKEHYDIYRYVDDFFVFYNDDKVKDCILEIYKIKLQEYNLFLNDTKTIIIDKPIITNITIAKEEIRKLIDNSLIFKIESSEAYSTDNALKYYKAKDIITNYKAILRSTETSYKDLQNYFLSSIFNRLKIMIKKIQKEQSILFGLYARKRKLELDDILEEDNTYKISECEELIGQQRILLKNIYKQIYKNFNEIIELSFFIYSVLPKVSYSIKICHILYRIIDFFKKQEITKQRHLEIGENISNEEVDFVGFDFDKKHHVFKQIHDGIVQVFNKEYSIKYSEVETLYLLQIVNELGKHYVISEDQLYKYFKLNDKNGEIKETLNYFTIMSLLNYIKNHDGFTKLKADFKKIILKKIDIFELNKAEDVFLIVDVLTCPYIAESDEESKVFRLKVLEKIKFFDSSSTIEEKNNFLETLFNFSSNWFYNWRDNDFGKELNTKRGHSVY